MEIEKTNTDRGFCLYKFEDFNGVGCSLQESSIAHEEGVIWFGCSEIGLKRLQPGVGWRDVELEPSVHTANTRMHLTQSQVAELLPELQYFVEHGRLPRPSGS